MTEHVYAVNFLTSMTLLKFNFAGSSEIEFDMGYCVIIFKLLSEKNLIINNLDIIN